MAPHIIGPLERRVVMVIKALFIVQIGQYHSVVVNLNMILVCISAEQTRSLQAFLEAFVLGMRCPLEEGLLFWIFFYDSVWPALAKDLLKMLLIVWWAMFSSGYFTDILCAGKHLRKNVTKVKGMSETCPSLCLMLFSLVWLALWAIRKVGERFDVHECENDHFSADQERINAHGHLICRPMPGGLYANFKVLENGQQCGLPENDSHDSCCSSE